LKANPGLSIYTVSKSGRAQNIGDYEPFKETVQYLEDNQELFKAHPIGAAFFAPQTGTSGMAAGFSDMAVFSGSQEASIGRMLRMAMVRCFMAAGCLVSKYARYHSMPTPSSGIRI
jgi:hypothetical protein